MKSKICFVSTILMFVFLTITGISAQTDNGSDDDKLKKFEVGGQFTALHQKSFQEDSQIFNVDFAVTGKYKIPSDTHQTEYGFGGRFTYNFNRNIAVEAEANYFPVDRLSVKGRERERIFSTNDFFRVFVEPQGRKFQAVIGPKIGYRGKKIGIFAKVRPGLLYIDRFPVVAIFSTSFPTIGSFTKKAAFFAADVGGVVEFYPSKKTILRFDIGDTIIRYNAQDPKQFNPAFTRHTLQTSIGFGFRF